MSWTHHTAPWECFGNGRDKVYISALRPVYVAFYTFIYISFCDNTMNTVAGSWATHRISMSITIFWLPAIIETK